MVQVSHYRRQTLLVKVTTLQRSEDVSVERPERARLCLHELFWVQSEVLDEMSDSGSEHFGLPCGLIKVSLRAKRLQTS